MKWWTRHFIGSWVKSQGLSPLFFWGTSTSQTSAGFITQQTGKSPGWFLECVGDNFWTQLVKEPTRGSKILDLLFVNREGLVGDVKVGSRLRQGTSEGSQQNCQLGLPGRYLKVRELRAGPGAAGGCAGSEPAAGVWTSPPGCALGPGGPVGGPQPGRPLYN